MSCNIVYMRNIGAFSRGLHRSSIITARTDAKTQVMRFYRHARPDVCCLFSTKRSLVNGRYENFSNKSRETTLLLHKLPATSSCLRQFSSLGRAEKQRRKEGMHDLVESSEPQQGQLTVGQKVKQAGKDASYMGVLIIGFGVTAVLIWYVVSELLFSFSPSSVYSKALKLVKVNDSVSEAVGLPMKAYGEETSRGRRRHVSHQEYVVNGVNYMRVKFYVSGSKRKATVHVDTKETSRGKFEFRYIFVELNGVPSETIVVVDNR